VNAQRFTDGIAVPARLQRIVLGEDLYSFPLPALTGIPSRRARPQA
jgi:hypothetical protein